MSTVTEVARRRASVRRLARGGASNRAIAAELGIGKDTVSRDLKWYELPLAERVAQRVAQTEEAVRHACAAAQDAADMRPAYVPADEDTARRGGATPPPRPAQHKALAPPDARGG
ncbi:hypothetical protein AB0C77_04400, partial [Streptomyces sp. NPDC048629]|uniref:helix-turn-helix domain-containing protein n=1 Tax=Streptomyces sp. NPDC048629 TaxID=3154824 RepID=UPI00342F0428